MTSRTYGAARVLWAGLVIVAHCLVGAMLGRWLR